MINSEIDKDQRAYAGVGILFTKKFKEFMKILNIPM